MRWAYFAGGISAVLLGALWFLQGIGAVSIPPVLCIAECEALQNPSAQWALMGAAIIGLGGIVIWRFGLAR